MYVHMHECMHAYVTMGIVLIPLYLCTLSDLIGHITGTMTSKDLYMLQEVQHREKPPFCNHTFYRPHHTSHIHQ